jgi:putative transposase
VVVELCVANSNSRPRVSNDYPYSEAQFKTMKCQPDFPKCFESPEDARAFLVDFFRWCNAEHRHSGLGLHSPHDVHSGRAGLIHRARQHMLLAAYAEHPERFVRQPPTLAALPTTVWINNPPPPAAPPGTQ